MVSYPQKTGEGFSLKAREIRALVIRRKGCVRCVLPTQQTLCQRAMRQNADTLTFAKRNVLRLDVTVEQVVARLVGVKARGLQCPLHLLGVVIRHAEVA